jgi:hypothetical protein
VDKNGNKAAVSGSNEAPTIACVCAAPKVQVKFCAPVASVPLLSAKCPPPPADNSLVVPAVHVAAAPVSSRSIAMPQQFAATTVTAALTLVALAVAVPDASTVPVCFTPV